MASLLTTYGLAGVVYLCEVALLYLMIRQSHWKRLAPVFLYIISLLALDGVGRTYVLLRYGFSSREYAYFFWLTDILLTLAAFALVCALFRRASLHIQHLWKHLRLMLALVLILVGGVSVFSLQRNYKNLFTMFIVEFQQNLYFTCLVLVTILYVLIQKSEAPDDELTLIVSGMGIQFAGPAANFALVYLTPGQRYASLLYTYVGPLCTLGMLLIWFYALSRVPKAAEIPARGGRVSELAAAARREA